MGRSTPLRCILLAAGALAENDTKATQQHLVPFRLRGRTKFLY